MASQRWSRRWNFFRPDDSLNTPLKSCTAFQHVVIVARREKKNGRRSRMGDLPARCRQKRKFSRPKKGTIISRKRFTPRLRIFGGVRLVQIRRRGGKGSSFRITRSFLSLTVILFFSGQKKAIPTVLAHTVCMNL